MPESMTPLEKLKQYQLLMEEKEYEISKLNKILAKIVPELEQWIDDQLDSNA